jgi:glycerol kinase
LVIASNIRRNHWDDDLLRILGAPADRPTVLETTALGAAYLAGYKAGLYRSPEKFARTWRLQRRFVPKMPEAERARRYAGWKDAVWRTLSRSMAI